MEVGNVHGSPPLSNQVDSIIISSIRQRKAEEKQPGVFRRAAEKIIYGFCLPEGMRFGTRARRGNTARNREEARMTPTARAAAMPRVPQQGAEELLCVALQTVAHGVVDAAAGHQGQQGHQLIAGDGAAADTCHDF